MSGVIVALVLFSDLQGWAQSRSGSNAARFGNPLEIGYRFHQMSPFFKPLYDQYGAFNLHLFAYQPVLPVHFLPSPLANRESDGRECFPLEPAVFCGIVGAVAGPPPAFHLDFGCDLRDCLHSDRVVDGHRLFSIRAALPFGPEHSHVAVDRTGHAAMAFGAGCRVYWEYRFFTI